MREDLGELNFAGRFHVVLELLPIEAPMGGSPHRPCEAHLAHEVALLPPL